MPCARLAAVLVGLALLTTGCSGSTPSAPDGASSPSPRAEQGSGPSARPERLPRFASPVRPADFRVATALRVVGRLAGGIGPRHATSPAYRRAAAWVADQFRTLHYDVRRQRVAVPGGISWGVPVDPGTSLNVIATPPGFNSDRPHLVVGAHLDTVPQAPGAEDNASGVGVLLAIADALQHRRPRLPVVLIAFGAEEPRGTTDADHHYGSRTYVASLGPAQRRAIRGMLSLDRVGVGEVVPVSSAGPSGAEQRATVLAAARQAGVATEAQVNRSSDHWQFVLAGLPGIRIGSTPYAAYHSAADLPAVVDRAQLARTGRLVLAWLG